MKDPNGKKYWIKCPVFWNTHDTQINRSGLTRLKAEIQSQFLESFGLGEIQIQEKRRSFFCLIARRGDPLDCKDVEMRKDD